MLTSRNWKNLGCFCLDINAVQIKQHLLICDLKGQVGIVCSASLLISWLCFFSGLHNYSIHYADHSLFFILFFLTRAWATGLFGGAHSPL